MDADKTKVGTKGVLHLKSDITIQTSPAGPRPFDGLFGVLRYFVVVVA
jgi:hypothetical protein